MPLIATNIAAAKSFHRVADATDRLRGNTTEISVTVAQSDTAFGADSLRRNLHAETMTELEKRLERKFVRKTGV